MVTAVAVVAAVLVGGAGLRAAAGTTTYYVSLGDSAAAGFQPNGLKDRGYADQLLDRLRGRIPGLRLFKLGCPGETTESLISGVMSSCSYPSGS
jgi:hypothetical protein